MATLGYMPTPTYLAEKTPVSTHDPVPGVSVDIPSNSFEPWHHEYTTTGQDFSKPPTGWQKLKDRIFGR